MFEKYGNIKFHENLTTGNRAFLCGQTNMKKPVIAFRNFANRKRFTKDEEFISQPNDN
jgi:hypothetical protein